MRDLDHFFNHTRDHYNFFNDFLNFYYFGNFDHFFNDLFNWHFDLFDSINMSEYFNYLFFNIFDWLGDLDIVVDNFLDLNYLWLPNNNRISDFNYDGDLPLDNLNTGFFNYFLNFYYSFMNNWNFNNSFHLVRNFLVNLHNFSDKLFYLSYSINWDYFLYNDLDRIRSINSVRNRHNLLDNLRNFNDSFLSLNDHNWLFNNAINNDVPDFNVIFNLFGSDHFDFFHNLFNNFLHFNYFWYSDDLFNDLFNIDWNLYNFLNYLLNSNNLFFVDDNFFDFSFNVVDNFSHSHRFFYLNYFLNYSINSVHFRNFPNYLNDSVLDSGDFNCFLNDLFNSHNLLLVGVHDDWNFDRYWNSLFDFHYLFNFHDFLNDLLNRDNLGHLDYSVNDFLNNFLNLYYLRDNSEDF